MLIVQKFGGSSVANAERVFNVAGIVTDTYRQGNDVVVVVSAQGDTTDDLIEKAREINPSGSKREMDMLLAAGEQISVALLAMAIEKLGYPVVSLLGWQAGFDTNSTYSAARIKRVTGERIRNALDKKRIVIVAGFQGINRYGDITTLGRGGSDTSAVAIAAAMHADLCQIYTDVDGVFTADPRCVKEARKLDGIDFLGQGTIYPDVVESGLGGESAVIKSHHNVGGLPDYVDFKEIIEPLRNLFKDEVRKAGLELGIPENLVFRQPFPGPGLGIRIIGEVTADKVRIVQDADAIYREEIAKAGLDRSIGQYFAALTNMRSVGVMGDERTYDYAVALRAVNTVDFMTAEAAEIPFEVLQTVMSRIINEVRGVNRIVYDITSKPPATIEWE